MTKNSHLKNNKNFDLNKSYLAWRIARLTKESNVETPSIKIGGVAQSCQDTAFAQAVKMAQKDIAKTKQTAAKKQRRIKCLHQTHPYMFYTESTHYRDISCICDACSTLNRNLHIEAI